MYYARKRHNMSLCISSGRYVTYNLYIIHQLRHLKPNVIRYIVCRQVYVYACRNSDTSSCHKANAIMYTSTKVMYHLSSDTSDVITCAYACHKAAHRCVKHHYIYIRMSSGRSNVSDVTMYTNACHKASQMHQMSLRMTLCNTYTVDQTSSHYIYNTVWQLKCIRCHYAYVCMS